jgi:hypothetical protein
MAATSFLGALCGSSAAHCRSRLQRENRMKRFKLNPMLTSRKTKITPEVRGSFSVLVRVAGVALPQSDVI